MRRRTPRRLPSRSTTPPPPPRRSRGGAFIVLGLWAAPLAAQPSPAGDPPALAELVENALAASPELLATEAARREAMTRAPQARALPDPMLAAGYVNDGWAPSLGSEEMTMLTVMASQELPFPGKRRLRGELAQRDVAAAEAVRERRALTLTAEVRRAYHQHALAIRLLELVHEQGRLFGEMEEAVRSRYAAGEGSEADVLRAQGEVVRLQQRHAHHELEKTLRHARLHRLVRERASSPLVAELELRPVAGSAEEWIAWSLEASPERRALDNEIEGARLAVELARRERKPDFSVQAGYSHRGGLDPMWQATFGLRLPLFRRDKQDQALLAAEARLELAGREREALDLDLALATEMRLAEMASIERIVGVAIRGLIPQDALAVEATLASYRAGRAPFVAILEAVARQYTDREEALRQIARHEELRAGLFELSLDGTTMAPMELATEPVGAGARGSRGTGAPGLDSAGRGM